MTYRQSTVTKGIFFNRPPPGVAGRIYLCSDSSLSFYDTGTTWIPIRADSQLSSMPDVSTLTAINAGGRATTLVNLKGGIYMEETNPVAASDYRMAVTNAPTGGYTFTVRMHATLLNANFSGAGIIWRNSSNGSIHAYGFCIVTNALQIFVRYETANNNGTSPTYTFQNADPVALANRQEFTVGDGLWLRQTDDGVTNKTWSFSTDGHNFMQIGTNSRTNQFTPDQIGIWIGHTNNAASAGKTSAFFSSWKAEGLQPFTETINANGSTSTSSVMTTPKQISLLIPPTTPNGNIFR